jgi:uncharacterized membrane protein YeaQ/YmgE (transglycosylase-associated protein family)
MTAVLRRFVGTGSSIGMSNMVFAVETPPAGIVAWILIGLIAGWVANLIMRRSGYGMLGDIVIGLVGAFFGGLGMISFFEGPVGFWDSIVVAVVGASGLLMLMWSVNRRQRTLRL